MMRANLGDETSMVLKTNCYSLFLNFNFIFFKAIAERLPLYN
jgi:hypothetical protein